MFPQTSITFTVNYKHFCKRTSCRTNQDGSTAANKSSGCFCQWEGEQFSRFTFTLIGKQMIKAAEIFRLDKLRGSRGQCALNLFKFCSSCDVCFLLNPGWNNLRLNTTFYSLKKKRITSSLHHGKVHQTIERKKKIILTLYYIIVAKKYSGTNAPRP